MKLEWILISTLQLKGWIILTSANLPTKPSAYRLSGSRMNGSSLAKDILNRIYIFWVLFKILKTPFDCLQFWLSPNFWLFSILIIFHFGRLPFWLYSILVVFHFGRLLKSQWPLNSSNHIDSSTPQIILTPQLLK